MKLLVLIAILSTVVSLATAVVIALYYHKKSGTGDVRLIGETGYVDSQLEPQGTVIVSGELWRATSKNGAPISSKTRVRVVGFANQLAIVEPE
jgi:membrane-bound ClpP family serine protease